MIKSVFPLAAAITLVLSGGAIAQKPKLKTASKPAKSPVSTSTEAKEEGLKPGLTMVFDAKSRKANLGDIMTAHITVSDPITGKVVNSTRPSGKPALLRVGTPNFRGDLMEELIKLSAGDSAYANIPADSLLKGVPANQRPPMFPSGSYVRFGMLIDNVFSDAEYNQNQRDRLRAYAAVNKLDVKETPSGLMYAITQPGTGDNIKANQKAEVHYTGKLLNGEKFDSSVDRGQPFGLTVGAGMVIKGWDEGLQLFNKGAKGVLLIPYNLAYGEQGSPPRIGAFEPLIFEIEIVNINQQ